MDFKYKRKYVAANGADGTGKRCSGKDGEGLVIKVPLGTVVRDANTGAVIKDMSDTDSFVIARGGRGGWGNSHFATPTRQAPRFAKNGTRGEERALTLELKLLADVGLVGFPNVGKSTLLSTVTKARPKIADYHFTTLYPNLGVVYAGEGNSFVMADIPGIIEGASEGAGLGYDFLRHIDRCRLIIHVVDVSGIEGRDPVEDFKVICEELERYSPELASRPMIVAANKCDIAEDTESLERFCSFVAEQELPFFKISAATHQGVKELVDSVVAELQQLPPIKVYEQEILPAEETVLDTAKDLEIAVEDGIYYVRGGWLERLLDRVNLGDAESRQYFERSLRNSGIYERMEEMGIKDGDTVDIYDLEFEYKK